MGEKGWGMGERDEIGGKGIRRESVRALPWEEK